MQKKLGDGQYQTRDEFKHDVNKIFDNARIYNQEETIYYKYANQLQAFVRPMLERLKETTPPDSIEGVLLVKRRANPEDVLMMNAEGGEDLDSSQKLSQSRKPRMK